MTDRPDRPTGGRGPLGGPPGSSDRPAGPNDADRVAQNGSRAQDASQAPPRDPHAGQETAPTGESTGGPPARTADETADEADEVLGTDEVAVTEVLLSDPAALAAERDEYLGALQRLKADFDNFRKRVVRQQEEQADRAASDLVGKLLPVLDTLDLAAAHLGTGAEEDAASQAVEALGQARAQLIDVLAKEGLQRVDETDVAFDPAVHDAVAHAPAGDADEPDTLVDEVMRSGYRWRGHVLRPAMVRVRG